MGPFALVLLSLAALGCAERPAGDAGPACTTATVVQTSRAGDQLSRIATLTFEEARGADRSVIALDPATRYQTILGFGGSFTESTAWVLGQLSLERRQEPCWLLAQRARILPP